MTKVRNLLLISSMLLLALFLAGPVQAQETLQSAKVESLHASYSPADEFGRAVYLVEFAEPGLLRHQARAPGARFNPGTPEMLAARVDLQARQQDHISAIAGNISRAPAVTHHFLFTHSGIALRLTAEEAARVASLPGVSSVQREQMYELDTFRGPEFIGAGTIWDGTNVPGGLALQGELMVAAILDTGVDPSHPSFTNDAACGHGVDGVPDKLLSYLDCQSTDVDGFCNGPSPQDNNGHGSHTASTVAGNRLDNTASPSPNLPPQFAEISGVAPCAHIRSYHVCQPGGCPQADIQGGMNTILGLHTDVDVMNFSISGGTSPWNDNDRRKLDLVDAGVFVAASAGNTSTGIPDPVGNVGHRGPWVASIAASTHDARIGNPLSLVGGPQEVYSVQGSGPSLAADYTGDLRYAGAVDAANFEGCSAFSAGAFDGEAALISRGACSFADKVNNAVAAGAEFVVIFNHVPGAPFVMGALAGTAVSAVMVDNSIGLDLVATLAGGTAELLVQAATEGYVDPDFGDILAGFSLRGPTPSPLQNLQKPDITAPGVNIYAAVPGGYAFLSGTSMSGPHAAGAAVLVRQAQPDWTPTEVKSALMMTASNEGTKEDGVTPWDPDEVGSGRTDLTRAALAGLVMDETFQNFLDANPATGGDVRTLNLAALRDLECSPQCSFTRTVRNTLGVATDWSVSIDGLTGLFTADVQPATFAFTGNTSETQTLTFTFTPNGDQTAAINFGQVQFTEGTAQSPDLHYTVALRGQEALPPVAEIGPDSFSFLLEENGNNFSTLTIANTGEADLLYTIDQAQPAAVVLDMATQPAVAPRDGQFEPISLVIDGGIATIIGVDTQQILWFNRFTPGPLDIPFTLEEVDIGFAPGNAGVQAGDLFDVHVWFDPDGDPTTGATHVASVLNQAITAGVNFQTVVLPAGIDIDSATGDVLIGVVNRTTAGLYRPAVADAPGNSQERSWLAFNFPGGVAANPPVFGDAATFGLLDNFLAGRNWTIRGFGTGGSACLNPSDVSWLTVTPAAGTIAGGDFNDITVTVDMAGLGLGIFEARLCIETNDENLPVMVIPIEVEVVAEIQLPVADVSPASFSFTVDFLSTDDDDLVIANNGAGDLLWDLFEPFNIPILPRSTTVHLDEDFSDTTFPPAGWSRYKLQGGGTNEWARTTLDFNSSPASARQVFSSAGDGYQETYLVTPQIALGSNPQLTFAERNQFATWYVFHGVYASTGSCDPNDGDFVLLEEVEGTNIWRTIDIDISAYANQNTCIAFGYEGQDATTWYIDDVIVTSEVPPIECYVPAQTPWLSVSASSGGVDSGQPADVVTVTVDGNDLDPGLYQTDLCVYTNDPDNSLFIVPVTLQVDIPATYATLEGTIEGLGRCSADQYPAAGASVTIDGQLETIMTTADGVGFFQVYLDAANSEVAITASAPDHIDGVEMGVILGALETTVVDFSLILDNAACATVAPQDMYFEMGADDSDSALLTLGNVDGTGSFSYAIQEAEINEVGYQYGLEGAGDLFAAEGFDRSSDRTAAERTKQQLPIVEAGIQGGPISADWAEGFEDITLLPGAGWFLQNNSSPLGTTDWFQGNPSTFEAHQGAPEAYIGANFNNTTGGTGIISNWLLTPEITLYNGTELRFWTRVPTSSSFPDRLEVRLSTSGASTDVGSAATDVGSFDTLLVSVNEGLTVGGYPDVWTEFVIEVEGLAGPTSGRFGFRYYVTNAGPAGANSNFIGIDTVSVTQPEVAVACESPSNVPWLDAAPFFGTVAAGDSTDVTVSANSTGLESGLYEAVLCVNTDDPEASLMTVPVSMFVLAPESLAFDAQPANTEVGETLAPVTVVVLDGFGDVDVGDNSTVVELSLETNPTGATLSGQTSVTVVNGVAEFNDLSIDAAGEGYRFEAVDQGGMLVAALSDEFNILQAASTTTIIEFDPVTQMVGMPYTVTVGVTGYNPTGMVTVSDDQGASCQIDVATEDSCDLTSMVAGTRTISADYAGDANNMASSDSDSYTVEQAASTTTITMIDPANEQFVNETYTVTVDVTGFNPTGMVMVDDGTGGSCQFDIETDNSCELSSTTLGEKTITALYAGDGNNTASSDTASYMIMFTSDELFWDRFEEASAP